MPVYQSRPDGSWAPMAPQPIPWGVRVDLAVRRAWRRLRGGAR